MYALAELYLQQITSLSEMLHVRIQLQWYYIGWWCEQKDV